LGILCEFMGRLAVRFPLITQGAAAFAAFLVTVVLVVVVLILVPELVLFLPDLMFGR